MKLFLLLLTSLVALSSCSVTIPLQSNLSDQTMLLAENKNIKANYTLVSKVPDGYMPYVSIQKNGTETPNNSFYIYASETAFKKIWSSYFSGKFNNYSKDQMDIAVTLKDLKLREQAATSVGMTMLTGNSTVNVEAAVTVHVIVDYHNKRYENQFEVTASDYNESQQMSYGTYNYTANQTNPTQQKSKLLESCLNKSIIQFENFLRSIMLIDKDGKQ
jgi:hypothetical protein